MFEKNFTKRLVVFTLVSVIFLSIFVSCGSNINDDNFSLIDTSFDSSLLSFEKVSKVDFNGDINARENDVYANSALHITVSREFIYRFKLVSRT